MLDQTGDGTCRYDVTVIGAGPAGATLAAVLAKRGHSVLVLESSKFPRFHIGESLLTYMVGLLDRLDMLNRINGNGYVVKSGVELAKQSGDFVRVDFADQGAGRYHTTFQVERADFDSALMAEARGAGAEVIEGALVTDLVTAAGRVIGVKYEHMGREHEVCAGFVVDASGRNGKIARAFGLRKTNERLRLVAVYRHFDGLDERNNPGHEGDIQVGIHQDGWVWAIPIRSDRMSLGAVTFQRTLRATTPEAVFEDHTRRIPRINQRMTGTAPLGALRVETDYCYYSDTVAGPGWFMVGDAGCFVDPLFSGGVYLAMTTGYEAAKAIDEIVADGGQEETVQRSYADFYKTGYDTYMRLLYAFYEELSNAHEREFNHRRYLQALAGDEVVDIKWVARLLAGDFWSSHNAMGRVLRAKTEWDTFEPFDRRYGCPIYPELDAAEFAYSGQGRGSQ
jgi:FADH2-dependent halogenase/halogenation protein CepH